MADILLFGGTSEGRTLAERLQRMNIRTLVCVATEYGEHLLKPGGSMRVHTGRLSAEELSSLIEAERPRKVIDATHPYASSIHQNLEDACLRTGTVCLRVLRDSCLAADCAEFESMPALISWLNARPGVIFSMLGAKEAAALTAVSDYAQRVWLRVLPSVESLSACLAAGFRANQIVCMQGPFSAELNLALMRAANAGILVTKESGMAGGFPEKLEAVNKLGIQMAVLKRPAQGSGCTLQELIRQIEDGTL